MGLILAAFALQEWSRFVLIQGVGGYEEVIRIVQGRSLASHWLGIALTIQMD